MYFDLVYIYINALQFYLDLNKFHKIGFLYSGLVFEGTVKLLKYTLN